MSAMPSVNVNGVGINYIQMQCEAGEACEDLVMIHGLATNLAFWYSSHAPALSRHYRVTLYDLRGHGRSGITECGYSAQNMALDLQQLLDHLGIERAHVVAHSFGGAVALNLACLEPGRFTSLMLVDTHISAVRCRQENIAWQFGRRVQRILDESGLDICVNEPFFGYRLLKAVAQLQLQEREIPGDLENLMRHLSWKSNKRTASRWLQLTETTQAEKELMGDDGLSLDGLRKLRFPIMALYGEYSQAMSTGEQLLEVWPHAFFRRVREAGHFFPITRPAEFLESGLQFWNGSMAEGVSRRKGENGKQYFRSDRFFNRGGKWFFHARESGDVGPFDRIEEAQEFLLDRIVSAA